MTTEKNSDCHINLLKTFLASSLMHIISCLRNTDNLKSCRMQNLFVMTNFYERRVDQLNIVLFILDSLYT